jgi:hypothetical protein
MQHSELVKRSQRPVVKPQHISSFGLLNRNGLEIPSGIEADPVEREEDAKRNAFTEWSMPEQRPGFIQPKKHDFF